MPPKRDRSREDAGKSDRSHIKHEYLKRAVSGQVSALRHIQPRARILLVDANAGDGEGVPQDQLDMFGENPSAPTPELLLWIAERVGNADVVLCEKETERRAALQTKFPRITVLGDHAEAAGFVTMAYGYGLWLGDPCGPSDQGVDAMRAFGRRLRSDFVLTFNEGFINRLRGTNGDRWKTSRERYLPFDDPDHWLTTLERRHMARTPLIKGSPNFRYRILVIANWLSDAVRRRPFEEVK